jgi:hypothetical protein
MGEQDEQQQDEQHVHWLQRAAWLSQLGLADGDPTPVSAVEEVADGVLALLDEVGRLQLEVAQARAWAWSGQHGYLEHAWVSVVPGQTYDGEPDQLPEWLTDARTPPEQDWWPYQPGESAGRNGT